MILILVLHVQNNTKGISSAKIRVRLESLRVRFEIHSVIVHYDTVLNVVNS
jgi:hypothetical protein